MSLSKISAIIAGILVIVYFIYNIFLITQISRGFGFLEGVMPEIPSLLIIEAIIAIPAILLWKRSYSKKMSYTTLLYPAVLGFGMWYLYFQSTDALEGGMMWLLIIIPTLIALSVLFVLKSDK